MERKPITIEISVDNTQDYLKFVNGIVDDKLTKQELWILSLFVDYKLESMREGLMEAPFGTLSRKRLKKELRIADNMISQYIKKYTEKGFIKNTGERGSYSIKQIVVPGELHIKIKWQPKEEKP
jgi:hypothetical protein